MKLTLKTLSKQFNITVYGSETITEIKAIMEIMNGVPPIYQELIFNGKKLENDKTLCDYGICDDTTITLMHTFRGG